VDFLADADADDVAVAGDAAASVAKETADLTMAAESR